MDRLPAHGSSPPTAEPFRASNRLLAAARSALLDAVTAEVVEELRVAGVQSVLLRGPAIARWLYGHESLRPYSDVDLLVPHSQYESAAQILEMLGFARWGLDGIFPGKRSPHAYSWVRARDRAVIDVHVTLRGCGAAPARVWDVLAAGTESTLVGGADVHIPAVSTLTAIVVLHAAQHGRGAARPLDDLALALRSLPEPAWREAASVAARLEATPSFATGLRLLPDGRDIADRLGLPHERSTEIALLAATAPPAAVSLEWLAREPGFGAKVVFAARKIAPAPAFMRASSPLARRGRTGLVVSYGLRPLRLGRHAWPGFRAWRRARKETR